MFNAGHNELISERCARQ